MYFKSNLVFSSKRSPSTVGAMVVKADSPEIQSVPLNLTEAYSRVDFSRSALLQDRVAKQKYLNRLFKKKIFNHNKYRTETQNH